MVSLTVYIVILAVSLFVYFNFFKRNKKTPPGPIGLPFLGHILQLGKAPYYKLNKWTKKYGNMMSLRFASHRVYVLSGYKLMKEVFGDLNFSGTPQDDFFVIMGDGPYGVLNAQKETWESQRRWALRHLRDFGFGKSSIESLILDEAKEVIEKFKVDEGTPIVVNRRFSLAVLNSLWTIVTGKRNSQDDPQLQSLLESLTKIGEEMTESGAGFIAIFSPWLMKTFPEWTKFNRMKQIAESFGKFVRETMKYHKKTLPEPESPRDFVDAYYHEIQKTKDPTSSFYGEIGEKNLFALLTDLFQAGGETSSTTLSWAMLYLGGHPNALEKLHKEIDNVVGKSRLPSFTDKSEMPYTEAVIMEVLRMSSLVPMGSIHVAFEDKEVNGYLIEKGDWVVGNIWGSHYDEEIWGDPQNFRPERFLSDDEKTVKKNDALLSFSVGRRQCMGETLARDTLFIFITSIFQRFNLKLHLPNGGKPDYEAVNGFIRTPKKFHVILEDRLN